MQASVYKGLSIEQERDGTWTIYHAGNPYATRGGYKTCDAAKDWIDKNF